MKQQAVKREQHAPEYGVKLDVLGRAIITQADERIKWHKQMAAVMAAELKAMTPKPGAAEDMADWQQHSRRTDLEAKISGHLEYARFLTFVRGNIVRTRRYRLGLTDMSLLEITPKGSYR
jgi:methionyl-tRNA formyltransferase